MKDPTTLSTERFRTIITRFYRRYGRDLPWRRTRDSYRVLVSEFMLQQTQVERVQNSYPKFLARFPDVASLANARTAEVLASWQGLGYNRRALALQRSARKVMEQYEGRIPVEPHALVSFPGIGPATAGAVAAFAGNVPAVFIETNIRRVFIHFYFPGQDAVSDQSIEPLVDRTLDRKNPREWYYALMDYGVHLKRKVPNPNRRSRHYRRQSPFENSHRQIRGLILKALISQEGLRFNRLSDIVRRPQQKVRKALDELIREGFVRSARERFFIA
ncbi:MAG: A/G-specific adenine glycosylase [Candidatus Omnitrophica bacterium]|nr:A/G-specific adenine glycosylase [Candidatus Omnitrophota bacterium]